MTALAKKQETAVSNIATPATLLQTAVEQNADLDKLERLMDLQDRWNADQAKNAYSQALAKFQSELGPIIKTRQAHNSKYADLDDIAQAIRPILDKNGLSYTFEQDQDQSGLKVTCVVRHSAGHSESNSLSAPNDTSGGKNQIQAIASTVTYLRRYTLTGALGITTGNEDSDGGKPEITVDELLAYQKVVRDEFQTIAAIKEYLATSQFALAKEAWFSIDQDSQNTIWRAPTKGGVFETTERTQMMSNEWSNA